MTSALFDPLFGADPVAARLDDASWVAALVAVEVALPRAAALSRSTRWRWAGPPSRAATR